MANLTFDEVVKVARDMRAMYESQGGKGTLAEWAALDYREAPRAGRLLEGKAGAAC